jgi:hypothetical protein
MLHRHLNHQGFTLAAIDDTIARGQWHDWAELRRAMLDDATLRQKISHICHAHIADKYAQRYQFWNDYAKERPAAP